jgi:hypothetical protein
MALQKNIQNQKVNIFLTYFTEDSYRFAGRFYNET